MEDGIPAKDIPKALVDEDVYVLIMQRAPREEELFTHALKDQRFGL